MLAIEVELLTGRYAAMQHNDRRRAEWPPHPARFFSALVAALYDRDPADGAEQNALEWLEQQEPPSLDVVLDGPGVGRRAVHDVYVPVNDVSLVGDIGKPLRDARARADALGSAAAAENASAIAAAGGLVEKEKTKLELAMGRHLTPDREIRASDLRVATALLPERRTRQVRTLPVYVPGRPWFAFLWQADPPVELQAALAHLLERVTRLGHSSSLVRCSITEKVVSPKLVPNPLGDEVLRTVGLGQLRRLESEFARHRGVEGRVLPARPLRYGPPAISNLTAAPTGVFSDEWIVFQRIGGPRPLSSRGTDLTRALRAALIEQHGTETLPVALSGHKADGTPAEEAHVAFVALPDVGHRHADAAIQGCAIVLPRGLGPNDREALFRLVAQWERDRAQADGTVELAWGTVPPVSFRRVELSEKASLNPARWCRPARRFVTATPIALDRNPGNLRSNQERTAHKASLEAQQVIADACERAQLPRPQSVEVSLAPLLTGAQPVRDFLPWPGRSDRTARVRVHARITFPGPVQGPVLLGAGRFFGLGLCFPVDLKSK